MFGLEHPHPNIQFTRLCRYVQVPVEMVRQIEVVREIPIENVREVEKVKEVFRDIPVEVVREQVSRAILLSVFY